MNADCTFRIGATHSVCQDYVIARNDSRETKSPYVILSDGCSSSPDTDIGARLLVKAAEQIVLMDQTSEMEELHRESARVALGWAELIGVAPQAVDATLLTAHVRGEKLIIACSGDGVIVLEWQEGVLDVHAISSPSGYPFYPSYAHQPERLAELVTNDRSRKELKHFRRDSADEPFRLISATSSDSLTEVFELSVSEYKYAAVASDGIHSFFHTQQSTSGKRVEAISMARVLDEFWSFKNSHGAFAERRIKKFEKDCHAKAWFHADDIAIGVIHLGDEYVRQSEIY